MSRESARVTRVARHARNLRQSALGISYFGLESRREACITRGLGAQEFLVVGRVWRLTARDFEQFLSHAGDGTDFVKFDQLSQRRMRDLVVTEELVRAVARVHEVVFAAVSGSVRDRVAPDPLADANQERAGGPGEEQLLRRLAGNDSWKNGASLFSLVSTTCVVRWGSCGDDRAH